MNTVLENRPNLSDSKCVSSLLAVEDSLYVIGGKWKIKLIIALMDGGSKRFNELQRTVKGISARVLSKELKELEQNGFVKRNVYAAQTPVVVEYLSTAYSETLIDIVKALVDWGIAHRKKITSMP